MGAMNETETTAIAVLSTKMDHVVGTLDEIKTALAANSKIFVTRTEWELLAQKNDVIHTSLAKDTAGLEKKIDDIEKKKAPWWIILSAAGTVLLIIAQVAQLFGVIK